MFGAWSGRRGYPVHAQPMQPTWPPVPRLLPPARHHLDEFWNRNQARSTWHRPVHRPAKSRATSGSGVFQSPRYDVLRVSVDAFPDANSRDPGKRSRQSNVSRGFAKSLALRGRVGHKWLTQQARRQSLQCVAQTLTPCHSGRMIKINGPARLRGQTIH